MKKIISKHRILYEYNKVAKVKINMKGAELLQEQAKRFAEENDCDAYIEISAMETKDGTTHRIV